MNARELNKLLSRSPPPSAVECYRLLSDVRKLVHDAKAVVPLLLARACCKKTRRVATFALTSMILADRTTLGVLDRVARFASWKLFDVALDDDAETERLTVELMLTVVSYQCSVLRKEIDGEYAEKLTPCFTRAIRGVAGEGCRLSALLYFELEVLPKLPNFETAAVQAVVDVFVSEATTERAVIDASACIAFTTRTVSKDMMLRADAAAAPFVVARLVDMLTWSLHPVAVVSLLMIYDDRIPRHLGPDFVRDLLAHVCRPELRLTDRAILWSILADNMLLPEHATIVGGAKQTLDRMVDDVVLSSSMSADVAKILSKIIDVEASEWVFGRLGSVVDAWMTVTSTTTPVNIDPLVLVKIVAAAAGDAVVDRRRIAEYTTHCAGGWARNLITAIMEDRLPATNRDEVEAIEFLVTFPAYVTMVGSTKGMFAKLAALLPRSSHALAQLAGAFGADMAPDVTRRVLRQLNAPTYDAHMSRVLLEVAKAAPDAILAHPKALVDLRRRSEEAILDELSRRDVKAANMIKMIDVVDACAGCCAPNTKLKYCSGCRVVGYCSEACQRGHWKLEHRVACRLVQC